MKLQNYLTTGTAGFLLFISSLTFSFRINPDPAHWQPVNLRRVTLKLK
jgi:hypothetical protein